MKDRASSTTPNARRTGAGAATGTSTVTLSVPAFVQDKKKLTLIAGGLAALVVILGVLVATKKPSPQEVATATPPATEAAKTAVPAKPAPPSPTEPAKTAEPAKPDAKVLEPTPTPGMIPTPAPTPGAGKEAPKEATKDVKKEGEKAAMDKAAADAKGEPAKGDAAKQGVPPATVFLDIKPWGEIFVNGKSQGVSPPKKFIKLDAGKYKIEFRNTTFPAKVENVDLKAREEITLRHRFQ